MSFKNQPTMNYNKPGSQKRTIIVGQLAEKISKFKFGETMSCLMVKDGYTYQIMAPEDLPMCTRNVIQQMLIPYSDPFIVLGDSLKELYGSIVFEIDEDSVLRALKVRDCVTIKHESEKHISLNWAAGQISDMVANSILSTLISLNQEKLNMNYGFDSLTLGERRQKKRYKAIHDILLSVFGDVKLEEDERFVIMVENNVAYIDKESGDVESENEGLKERLTKLYKHIRNRVAVPNNCDQYLRVSPWIPPAIWEDDEDDETTIKLQRSSRNHDCPPVYAPQIGETVDLTPNLCAYEVQLSEELMSNVLFKKHGEYEVAWVDVEVGKTEGDMLLLVPLSSNALPHNSVFIGDFKMADFKQFLATKGVQAEFSGEALRCGEIISFREVRDPTQKSGQIIVQGLPTDDYYTNRDFLYSEDQTHASSSYLGFGL